MSAIVVVGGGLAGLTAALAGVEAGHEVTLLDDGAFRSSASVQAQGGFSAVTAAGLAAGDSVASHVADTLEAGARHGDPAVAAAVCAAAEEHVGTLTRWGTVWDTEADGTVSLTREAAHAASRILHVGGDATGAGIVEALRRRAEALGAEGRLRLDGLEEAGALLLGGGAVAGVAGAHGGLLGADAVILASGGISGAYGTRTSRFANPGDAAALAWRAGAVLADAEMVQFHPTYCAEAGFMVSEALRGEGAVLRDATGRRFMLEIDERAELAPRDVVARGVARAQGGAWLDASPIVEREGRGFLARRFPTITATLAQAGLDLERAPIPVRPAQHYWMGGVAVDAHARSTVPGLLVAGEASRTGLHGANRLASNSLLEAVHTGLAAVATVSAGLHRQPATLRLGAPVPLELEDRRGAPLATVRTLADRHLGVEREAAGLSACLVALDPAAEGLGAERDPSCASSEALTARLIAHSAQLRPGSLGAHHRLDAAGEARPGATVTLVNPHPATRRATTAPGAAAGMSDPRKVPA
ncbi:FAD-binding protein [Galactobacter valiniphilus]|uniref:FAD-binding protein n=1 Tax=Galactobacter valiniphilus TaxID=2676122 RepID=UPI003735AEE0